MRIKTRDDKEWHKVFALLPRKVGHTWVWLERCWRRWKPGMMWPTFGCWEYKLAETTVWKFPDGGSEIVEVSP